MIKVSHLGRKKITLGVLHFLRDTGVRKVKEVVVPPGQEEGLDHR